MGGFLNTVLGTNPTLNTAIGKAGDISNFGTGVGQGAITDADSYYKNILSNDPSKIAESIAPEISAGAQGTQQEKQQLAQFGTRSGGTAAASAGADAANRTNIMNLIAKLKGQAAGAETGIGENQSAIGLAGNKQQADLSQEQLQNFMNSILGTGISGGITALEGGGIGKLFK